LCQKIGGYLLRTIFFLGVAVLILYGAPTKHLPFIALFFPPFPQRYVDSFYMGDLGSCHRLAFGMISSSFREPIFDTLAPLTLFSFSFSSFAICPLLSSFPRAAPLFPPPSTPLLYFPTPSSRCSLFLPIPSAECVFSFFFFELPGSVAPT